MSAVRVVGQDQGNCVQPESDVVARALGEAGKRPEVRSFFDEPTNTASHVVWDLAPRRCAVIDSVLDYDAASGRTATESADELVAFIQEHGLEVEWILETHVHADHLSAAPYVKERLGGALGVARTFALSKTSLARFSMPGPNFSETAANSTICSSTASASRSANSMRSPCTHLAIRLTA